MPYVPPGEPRPAPKPQPLGNAPFLFLFTTCAACAVFLLWRRAAALRGVVAHQLKTWTRRDGAVRLSTDDGPPAAAFLGDGDGESSDEDSAADEPLRLADRAQAVGGRYGRREGALPEVPGEGEAPVVPPK